jgi:rod shape-determining protein MreC
MTAINSSKSLFSRGPALSTRLAALVLLSVAAMALDRYGHMEPVRAALGVTMYPVQMAVHLPLQAGHWALDMVTLRRTLLEENERLREAQLLTSARLMKLEELEAENRRLRNLLDSSIEAGEQVLIAEVLAVEMDPFTRQLLLNKGSRSKVYRGQPIIDAQGVMGQVIHVNPITATALLITDPSHALPVQFSRNGLRSVAVGTGVGSTLELLHLPNNADVTVGDRVVTSGLGGRFPAGYLVGEVVAVDTETGRPFARVLVEPSAQLERNREVLLVWPPQVPVDGPEGEPGEVAGG